MKKKTLALLLSATLALCSVPAYAKEAPVTGEMFGFDQLEERVRTGNLNYLVLEENIAQIELTDYEEIKDDLRDAMNQIGNAQWKMTLSGSAIKTGNDALDGALKGIMAVSTSSISQSLQSQFDSLEESFEDLKDGEIQKDAADMVLQLRNTQNTLVMVTEGMYIQLAELEATDAAMERALASLDRQIQELELRHKVGQISSLTLQQAKTGRTTLVSNQQSLRMGMQTLALNLEAMLGEELTGTLPVAELPQVTTEELEAMDLEKDLAKAMEKSYELYAAGVALEDAEEDFKDAGKDYHHNPKVYQYAQAQHAWQAAQHTHKGAVQSYELKFRSLYAQVKDYAQIMESAKASLALEEENYAVDKVKYEQGTLSQNALLTAQDDLTAAQDAVATAQRNLFSAYNNYCWAVEYGILN